MRYNIPERAYKDIITLADKCGIRKIILFGSRARGTNHERSDIDLAICGGDITRFSLNIDDEVWTLLNFDVVNMDRKISDELKKEIERDGVVIYEKV